MIKVDTKGTYTTEGLLNRNTEPTVRFDDVGFFPNGNRLLRSDVKSSITRYGSLSGVTRTKQFSDEATVTGKTVIDESDIVIDDNNAAYFPYGMHLGPNFLRVDEGVMKVRMGSSWNNTSYMFTQNDNLKSWAAGFRNSSNPDYYLKYYDGSSWSGAGYISRTRTFAAITFTGQHRSVTEENIDLAVHKGLIVVSTGVYQNIDPDLDASKPSINESLPKVELSSKRNQKSAYGVLSDQEDSNEYQEHGDGTREKYRTHSIGSFVTMFPKTEEEPDRLIINSLGEGGIWICNINGNLENGDYITTCEVPGHGMLQDDDLLHNSTVAKITQDCTFELDNPNYDCVEFEFEGQTYRKAFVGCTYHCG